MPAAAYRHATTAATCFAQHRSSNGLSILFNVVAFSVFIEGDVACNLGVKVRVPLRQVCCAPRCFTAHALLPRAPTAALDVHSHTLRGRRCTKARE